MVKTAHAVVASLLLMTSCASGPQPPLQRDVAAEHRAEITKLVRSRTDEPILDIKRVAPDEIQVTTGWTALDSGGGKEFRLKKVRGKWMIIEELMWVV
jgi:hypothetical protein